MYNVWFSDLEKVLKVFHEKFPHIVTFSAIEGNAYGDFIIRTASNKYLVKHSDFSVWRLDHSCRWGNWVEVE